MRIPTSTSSKSHLPNWLEKLRKVKGFPSVNDDHLSLEHFLSQQPHQQQQQEEEEEELNDDEVKRPAPMPENDDVSTRMSNMLSDLFSDGRSGRSSNFKAPRKQPCPRICVVPVPVPAAVTEDRGSNDSDRDLELKRKVRRGLKEEEDEGRTRKLGECGELVGFSRTEVTVIDSSSPLWKFDKYLFRKKNVWKARDCRRGGMRYNDNNSCVGFGRKKKRDGCDDEDEDGGGGGIVVSKKIKSFGARK